MLQQVVGHLHRIGAVAIQGAEGRQRLGRLARHRLFEQGDGLGAVGQSQHVAHRGRLDHRAALGLNQRLIQQAEAVAHRPFGRA